MLDRAIRRHGSESLLAALSAPLAAVLVATVTGLLVSDALGEDLLAAAVATAVGTGVYLTIALATARQAVLTSWHLLRSGVRRKTSPAAGEA